MKCPSCGYDNPETAAYCPLCCEIPGKGRKIVWPLPADLAAAVPPTLTIQGQELDED